MIQNQLEFWENRKFGPNSSSKRQDKDIKAISKMDFIGQNRYLEAMSVEWSIS